VARPGGARALPCAGVQREDEGEERRHLWGVGGGGLGVGVAEGHDVHALPKLVRRGGVAGCAAARLLLLLLRLLLLLLLLLLLRGPALEALRVFRPASALERTSEAALLESVVSRERGSVPVLLVLWLAVLPGGTREVMAPCRPRGSLTALPYGSPLRRRPSLPLRMGRPGSGVGASGYIFPTPSPPLPCPHSPSPPFPPRLEPASGREAPGCNAGRLLPWLAPCASLPLGLKAAVRSQARPLLRVQGLGGQRLRC